MASTRREILKLGGLGTMAAMLPSSQVSAHSAGSSAVSPLDPQYLRHGLNTLCSAHQSDPFSTGHAGGAYIAAYFLCREETLEEGTAEVIKTTLDRYYGLAPDPFPVEEPVQDGIASILEAMEEGVEQLCRDGHNVIFLSLALKAMHELPETVTPARIEGLRRTIRALEPRKTGTGDIPVPESASAFSEFVLKEFLASTEGGPGQGYSGHLLTYGRAILDLRQLGHEPFAQKCLNAYQLAVKNARPRSPGKDYQAKRDEVDFLTPDRKEYWERRASTGTIELGHLFKYPYGFFGLRRQSGNDTLNRVCLDNSYRLFRS